MDNVVIVLNISLQSSFGTGSAFDDFARHSDH